MTEEEQSLRAIEEKAALVFQRVEQAALRAGRSPRDVTLLAATKTRSAAEIQKVIACGVAAVGENRVQELLQKREEGAYAGASLHFIGSLQSNKAKYLVGAVDLVHSAGSDSCLSALSREAEKKGVMQDILLEVNIGGEEAKSGFPPDGLSSAASRAAGLPGLRLRGLMAVPPAGVDPAPYFEKMKRIFDGLRSVYGYDVLSMGMSADFERAIEYGSTVVRVGSALFGPRADPALGREGP